MFSRFPGDQSKIIGINCVLLNPSLVPQPSDPAPSEKMVLMKSQQPC